MCTFLSGFFHICHTSRKRRFLIMRKEQITATNSAENKDLEGKGMKQRFIHFKKRMVPTVSGALMGGGMLMSTRTEEL
jgi:hypothetical protein